MQEDVHPFAVFEATTAEDHGDVVWNAKFSADRLAGVGRRAEASRFDTVVHHGNPGCDLGEPGSQGIGHGLTDSDDPMIAAVDEAIQRLEEWVSPAIRDVVLPEDVTGVVDYQRGQGNEEDLRPAMGVDDVVVATT